MMTGSAMAAIPERTSHPRLSAKVDGLKSVIAHAGGSKAISGKGAGSKLMAVSQTRRPRAQLASVRARTGGSGGAYASEPNEMREAGNDYVGAYEPAADGHQVGIASWYGGQQWNGHRTSDGGIFSDTELTAAHATLPMGSLVRVTLGSSDRSVVVRINDRPGTRRRIIDLSRAAAEQLGMLSRGTAVVMLSPL